jgi:hypothetical protein
MRHWLDDHLTAWLIRWVQGVRRRLGLVLLVEASVTVALLVFVLPHLGINMDHKKLIDPDLPFQRTAAEFARYFPTLDDALLVVVDGPTPETTREAAGRLRERLRADRKIFRDVYEPGGSSFFLEHGLLYRSPAELDDFVDHLAALQPVLAELSRDPRIANLARLIRLGLAHERAEGKNAKTWAAVLDRISDATVRVFDEYPVSISWESLMLEGSALDAGTRKVIIIEPFLDFEKILVADRAIKEIRAAASSLPLVREGGVRVRITGNPALNYEEMLGLAWDIGYSSLGSFALVTAILFVAFRSLRLAAGAALTLLAGLIWTSAFATLAVGQLNVISIAFGVLFIGLGIDFAIHLGMQYVEALQKGLDEQPAWSAAVRETGSSLVICALTTAVGFFAFIPTPYRGVGELGLIAGTGMLIILFQSFTFFPAIVTVLLGAEARSRIRSAFSLHLRPPRFVVGHARTVVVAAALIGTASFILLPRIRFDVNVVQMRNPRTESVQTFNDLVADSRTSPWYVDALAADLDAAERLGRSLRKLDLVENALSLRDYVPEEQEEKIEILAEASFLLDVPAAANSPADPLPVEEQVQALRELHDELDADWPARSAAPLAPAARRLHDQLGRFLDRVAAGGDASAALADLERILLGTFPRQLERLQKALAPSPVTLDALPADLKRRLLSPDGHARVQIFPRAGINDAAAMGAFVDAVRAVAPEATGVVVNLVELGRVTSQALRQALLSALLAIALMVLLLFQSFGATLAVLAPITLAALVTAASMVLSGMPFNFANVVVLPLLLGIGVDSSIHLVHRALESSDDLLDTTTARAVLYSARTTLVSFGNLAFSAHRGIASMGLLLVAGMLLVLLSNLGVLPALLALRRKWG